jgi:short-subunit dehydrogenase
MDDFLSLQDQNILITGASSGMGRVFAQMIARQGARVSLLARNEERLKQTLDSLEGHGHKMYICDLTDEGQLKDTVIDMEPLDGIVLCAGINNFVPVKFIKQDKIDKMFQTNYFSQLLLIQMLLKKKLVCKGGSIVFISSISLQRVTASNLTNPLVIKKITLIHLHRPKADKAHPSLQRSLRALRSISLEWRVECLE